MAPDDRTAPPRVPAADAHVQACAGSRPCVDRYRGQSVALLTQHGKEQVLNKVLGAALGCRIQRVSGDDTDLLGTFTREIPRAGTQVEAARKKARMGMALAGASLGLASEGAFGPDPVVGMMAWNVEVLLWVDDVDGLEVVGRAQGTTNFAHLLTADRDAADAFAGQCGFPDHGLVVRPEGSDDPRIRKDIGSWAAFGDAFAKASAQASSGRVFIETDMRAHANPTRQLIIRRAAENLASRLCTACPQCGAPGFWTVERVAGLPCAHCGTPTQEPVADLLGCVKCLHREIRERTDRRSADPERCDACNP